MATTLAIDSTALDKLLRALAVPLETAFIGAVRFVPDLDGRTTILLRDLEQVPDDGYLERSEDRLVISSSVFVPMIGRVADDASGVLFVHTHPGGFAEHSALDEVVDHELATMSRVRTRQSLYASLVVAGGTPPLLVGRYSNDAATFDQIDRVRTVGDRIRIDDHPATRRSTGSTPAAFDRQVRAFGAAGQEQLRGLRAGIVGAGGTGSAVAEQLLRLGVGELIVADDDNVDATNVPRIYGAGVGDIGQPKVDVVAANAERIGLGSTVTAIYGKVTELEVAKSMRHCDVVFGCTDDQAGRAVLSRLAYHYLIPTFDISVLVGSLDGDVREVVGRVTYLAPGQPCLLCRGRISAAGIAADSLRSDERDRLAAEGYVLGLGEPAPSVVTYTTLVAATATSELIARLFGIGAAAAAAGELLLRIDRRDVRTLAAEPTVGHYCIDKSQWAQGDTDPLLGQVWA